MYPYDSRDFGRVGIRNPDAELRRSFFRHLAALAGAGLLNPGTLVAGIATAVEVDARIVDDLKTLADRHLELASEDAIVFVTGYMSVVGHLALVSKPPFTGHLEQLHARAAVVLAQLTSFPD